MEDSFIAGLAGLSGASGNKAMAASSKSCFKKM
jgi:hypothetical protein